MPANADRAPVRCRGVRGATFIDEDLRGVEPKVKDMELTRVPTEYISTPNALVSEGIAGDNWRQYTRRYGIEHALRVAANGHIEVTRELRARLQFASGTAPVTVVD